jgi:hypothetical protein
MGDESERGVDDPAARPPSHPESDVIADRESAGERSGEWSMFAENPDRRSS